MVSTTGAPIWLGVLRSERGQLGRRLRDGRVAEGQAFNGWKKRDGSAATNGEMQKMFAFRVG